MRDERMRGFAPPFFGRDPSSSSTAEPGTGPAGPMPYSFNPSDFDKEKDIIINSLPENRLGYTGSRTHVTTKLLGAVPLDFLENIRFHEDIDTKTFSQLRNLPDSPKLVRANNRLYTAIAGSLKSAQHVSLGNKIANKVAFGNGRLALKVFDLYHGYVATRIAQKGSDALHELKAHSMSDFHEYVTVITEAVNDVAAFPGTSCPDLITLGFLERGIENIQDTDLSATLANFRLKPYEEKTAVASIDVLEDAATRWQMKEDDKKPNKRRETGNAARKGGGGKDSNNGGGKGQTQNQGQNQNPNLCHWCLLPGHKQAQCRKKARGEPKATTPPPPRNQQGRGGRFPNNDGGKSFYPPARGQQQNQNQNAQRNNFQRKNRTARDHRARRIHAEPAENLATPRRNVGGMVKADLRKVLRDIRVHRTSVACLMCLLSGLGWRVSSRRTLTYSKRALLLHRFQLPPVQRCNLEIFKVFRPELELLECLGLIVVNMLMSLVVSYTTYGPTWHNLMAIWCSSNNLATAD